MSLYFRSPSRTHIPRELVKQVLENERQRNREGKKRCIEAMNAARKRGETKWHKYWKQ